MNAFLRDTELLFNFYIKHDAQHLHLRRVAESWGNYGY